MARIFLSYRRSDSQDVAGRIFDRLIVYLSRGSVFKDVDSIPAGVDFTIHLQQALSDCSVVLALIGPTYLSCTDSAGRRRLFDDPADFVRREIEAALSQQLPIIPLTVSGATMPTAAQLPQSLQPVAKMNGLAIRPDPDFNRDIDRLLLQLAPFLGGHIRAELEQRRQQAARLRDRLSYVAWQFNHTSDLMNQGYPLIEGAAYIAREIGRRLGEKLCPSALRELLASDDQLALSSSIVGWWQAHLPRQLDRARGELLHSCAELGGHLGIFGELMKMFELIWKDAYSPHIFLTIMSLTKHLLLADEPPDLSPTETVQALTNTLHGISAMYYVTRYEKATKLMNKFIERAAQTFRSLSDDDLVSLTQGSTADADREPTHTGTMRILLSAAKPKLPPADLAILESLIDEIEKAISKEQASAELESHKKIETGDREV